MKKRLECPECRTICKYGRLHNHQSFSLLSLRFFNGYYNIGIHFSNSKFSHCASFKIGRKQLSKILFEESPDDNKPI